MLLTIEKLLPLCPVFGFKDKDKASTQKYQIERIQGDITRIHPSVLLARQ